LPKKIFGVIDVPLIFPVTVNIAFFHLKQYGRFLKEPLVVTYHEILSAIIPI
jgi:hypothetical protein